MQSIKLNLIPGSVLPVVNVSQYDVGRQFNLNVYEGATAYSLTGKTVEIRGTKPDGNGFAYDSSDGALSVSNNTVTISTLEQMTPCAGKVMCELRISSGTTVLSTLNFIMDCEPSALADDVPLSETDIPAIERDFEAALEEAEADALVAEGYAKGTQEGVPVASESPYYNNNAEHFKDEAEAAASYVLEKYPKIVNDYWYAWDIDADQYVNTGVRAKGTQGDPGAPGHGVPAGGTTGQVLKKASDSDYDTEWGTGGGGASALDDLTDVSITSAADGDLLQYNGTSGEWENSAEIPNAVSALEETGAVNLRPNILTAQVKSGVTLTVNSDKTVSTANTVSGTLIARIFDDFTVDENKNYKLTGCPAGGSDNSYYFSLYDVTDGADVGHDTGDGLTASLVTTHSYRASVVAINGTNMSGLTFKPMFSDAALNLSYSDYQPYAMTNRELTEVVSSTPATNITLAKCGNIKRMICAGATVANIKNMTIPADYRPQIDMDQAFSVIARNASGVYYFAALLYDHTSHSFNANHPYSPTYGSARSFLPDDMQIFSSITWI